VHGFRYNARVLSRHIAEHRLGMSPARPALRPGEVTDHVLAHFLDVPGPDSVAVTIEADGTGAIYPALYLRRSGRVAEHLLPPAARHEFRTADHRALVSDRLGDLAG
jgi:hypothetical protein